MDISIYIIYLLIDLSIFISLLSAEEPESILPSLFYGVISALPRNAERSTEQYSGLWALTSLCDALEEITCNAGWEGVPAARAPRIMQTRFRVKSPKTSTTPEHTLPQAVSYKAWTKGNA